MRKRLFFGYILLTFCAISAKSEHFRHQWRFSPPLLNESQNAAVKTIVVPEASDSVLQHNWPALPKQTVEFTFPMGTSIQNVRILTSEIQRIPVEQPLPFSSGLYYLADPSKQVAFPSLMRGTVYPESHASVTMLGGIDPATFQATSRMMIDLIPCRYHYPDELFFASSISVEFDTTPPETTRTTAGNRDEIPFLLITSNELSDAVDDYASYRQLYGPPVTVVTIEQIISDYPGIDDAQKMRHAITDYVENHGTAFVLLAGDADVLPVRRTVQMNDQGMNMPMEAYFSDLFDATGTPIDWDADSDGIFGQYPNDLAEMDLMPDLFLGRIPASTPEELTIALDHVMDYEQSTSPTSEWFNRVVFSAVDIFTLKDHGDTSGIPEGERFAELLRIDPFQDMQSFRLYETDLYDHEGRATSPEISAALHDGAGFLAFHCHGAPDCFWLIDECYTGNHVAGLDNGSRLPVTFGFACSTAAFDNELPDWPYGSITESMPEQFLLNPDGGGISYVGSTRVAVASSFGHAQQRRGTGALEYPYFQAYFESRCTPGQMIARAQTEYLRRTGIADAWDFSTLAEYAQFGDPSTAIGGFASPGSGSVSIAKYRFEIQGGGHDCAIPGDTLDFTPTLLNSGFPVDQVSVVISSTDPRIRILNGQAFYGQLLRGCLRVPASPVSFEILTGSSDLSPAEIKVSIRSADFELSLVTCSVPIGPAPHIQFRDWDIYYDSSQNVNIDPGDDIYLAMIIENDGCSTLENASIRMSSTSEFLEYFYADPTALPPLPAQWGMVSPWAAVRFLVKKTTPDNTIVPITITITVSETLEFTHIFDLIVRDRMGPAYTWGSLDSRSLQVEQPLRVECALNDISGIESASAVFRQVSLEQSATVTLFDDGTHGDTMSSDGIYSTIYTLPSTPDDFETDIIARDGLGNLITHDSVLRFSSVHLIPAPVLLIDELDLPVAESKVETALTRLGITHATWNIYYRGQPEIRELKKYSGSVAFYVSNTKPSPSMLEVLSEFFDLGGAIVMTGWDAARQINRLSGGADWLNTHFGVQYISKNANDFILEGIEGDPIGEGLSYGLKKKEGDVAFEPDVIQPINGALTCVQFHTNQEASGAIRFESGLSRSVFYPYALDAIKDQVDLDEILQSTYNWASDRDISPHLDLILNDTCFSTGESFELFLDVVNPHDTPLNGKLFLVLNLGSDYWFWPSFVHHLNGIDYMPISLEPFDAQFHELSFIWPDTPMSIPDVTFLAAILDEGMTTVTLGVETVQFGFGAECQK